MEGASSKATIATNLLFGHHDDFFTIFKRRDQLQQLWMFQDIHNVDFFAYFLFIFGFDTSNDFGRVQIVELFVTSFVHDAVPTFAQLLHHLILAREYLAVLYSYSFRLDG